MKRTLDHLAETRALPGPAADKALGVLDGIRRDEARRRALHGGRLTRADLKAVNAALTTLGRTIGLT